MHYIQFALYRALSMDHVIQPNAVVIGLELKMVNALSSKETNGRKHLFYRLNKPLPTSAASTRVQGTLHRSTAAQYITGRSAQDVKHYVSTFYFFALRRTRIYY